MNQTNLIAIDTETGGAGERQCCSHALLSVALAGSHRSMDVYVLPEPGLIIDPRAAAVNGYGAASWEELGAVPEHRAVATIIDWLAAEAEATGAVVTPVAHNAGHDRGFIEAAMDRQGRLREWNDLVSRRWRCSCAVMRAAMDAGIIAEGYASLDDLSQAAGMARREKGAAHVATDDAYRCRTGYLWLVDKMSGRGGLL